jgi:hypothetical protein
VGYKPLYLAKVVIIGRINHILSYISSYTLAHLLGHKSLEDYVSHIVVQNIEMEISGGDIDIDQSEVL